MIFGKHIDGFPHDNSLWDYGGICGRFEPGVPLRMSIRADPGIDGNRRGLYLREVGWDHHGHGSTAGRFEHFGYVAAHVGFNAYIAAGHARMHMAMMNNMFGKRHELSAFTRMDPKNFGQDIGGISYTSRAIWRKKNAHVVLRETDPRVQDHSSPV